MKRTLTMSAGILLILGATWGGPYGLDIFPEPAWQNFPIRVTAGLTFFSGFVLVLKAAYEKWG